MKHLPHDVDTLEPCFNFLRQQVSHDDALPFSFDLLIMLLALVQLFKLGNEICTVALVTYALLDTI